MTTITDIAPAIVAVARADAALFVAEFGTDACIGDWDSAAWACYGDRFACRELSAPWELYRDALHRFIRGRSTP